MTKQRQKYRYECSPGTLYLTLLRQLPVSTLLKLEYLIIFVISQILFISY